MITPTDVAADEFLAVARQALRADPTSTSALDALGWWDLLELLDDRTMRFATFALFRAQGHELADTPALGALMAQPYAAALGLDPSTVIAAVSRRAMETVTVGDVAGRQVVVALPGRPVELYDVGDLRSRPLDVPGRLTVHALEPTGAGVVVDLTLDRAEALRRTSIALGRTALAAEMLGAAEGAVELAVEHARVRTQFGQPIGGFQAIRHLLAWALTDCAASAAVVRQSTWFGPSAVEQHDEVTKALAGRNSRRACERSLQVLGGIGFTAEHVHHHHFSRVLLLDGLLGSSADLTHALGARTRERGAVPAFTAHGLALDE